MSFRNTFFGAALGFIIQGPIGSLLGAVIGSLIPDGKKEASNEENRQTKSEFTYSLIILFAIVIKSDNKTRKSEILFVKDYLIKNFGTESAKEMMQILKSLLTKEINAKEICSQIRLNTDYYFRMELIHLLFKLAAADGVIAPEEFTTIRDIASRLSMGQLDFIRIASMFASYSRTQQDYSGKTYTPKDDLENAYNILGIKKTSDKDEVKKAFRKLSKEYHPDRVAHLGEEYQDIAKEKFIKIKDAYDLIIKNIG